MHKKKILVLTGGYLPIPATNGGAVETLINYLLDYNEQNQVAFFDVLTPPSDDDLQARYKNVRYININEPNVILKILFKLIRHITHPKKTYFLDKGLRAVRGNTYDLILCENEPEICPLVRSIFGKEVKIVLHLHNDILNNETKNRKEIINSCDKIIAVSNFIRQRVDSEKAVTCYNGTSLDVAAKAPNQNVQTVTSDGAEFLYVGRIVEEKGIAVLLEAFAASNRIRTVGKLTVVGSTFFGKTKENKFFRNLKKKNYLNVEYTGFLQGAQLDELYGRADVIVIPSIVNESFGLVAIEAMARGKYIIASDSGALPELLRNYKNKTIVKRSNLREELVKAILTYNNKKRSSSKIDLKKFSKDEYCRRIFNELGNL